MNNLIFSINVILPLVIEMALGQILRITDVIDGNTSKKMNSAIFKLFLPVLIFYNVYTSEIADVFNAKLILYAVLSIFILVGILAAAVPLFEKDKKKIGVIIQGIFRSNFVIFGVPLSIALSGNSISGTVSVLVACVIPTFNLLAVIVLESFKGDKPDFKKILLGIASNPLIISSILGFVFLFAKIKIYAPVESTLKGIAVSATPLALIILGASIDIKKIRGNTKQIAAAVTGRLIVVPAIFLSLAAILGFRNGYLAILIALYASPGAVSSYPMASQMGADGELAAQIVMMQTCLCSVTVFLFIFILKHLGLI